MTQGPRLEKSCAIFTKTISRYPEKSEVCVEVGGLVKKFKDLPAICIAKIDSLICLASKTEQAEKFQSELEKEWLAVLDNRHGDYVEKSGDYIDSVLDNKSPTKKFPKKPKTPCLVEPLRSFQ